MIMMIKRKAFIISNAKIYFQDWVWEVYDKDEETRDFLTWICDSKTISHEANILTNEEIEKWEKLNKESPNSVLSGQRLKDAIEIIRYVVIRDALGGHLPGEQFLYWD